MTPQPTSQVTYLLPAPAQPFTKTYSVPPRTRQNIWVNVEDARLAHAEVSAVFASSLPVIVERAMYRDTPGQVFAAGHEAAAVPGPATQWFFAEGATGPYFDLFYLIANPGTTAAVIDGRYLLPDGTVLTKQYTVAPQSRFNVWADYETFPGPARPAAREHGRLGDVHVSQRRRVRRGARDVVARRRRRSGSRGTTRQARCSRAPSGASPTAKWAGRSAPRPTS